MKSKLSKKSKRRVILISFVTLSLMILIIINVFSVWRKLIVKYDEKKHYTLEYEKLVEEEEYLKVEVQKLQDPDYVARYAREQFLYSKDGEYNIRIK